MGGVPALAECLEEQSVMYGLVRVSDSKGKRGADKEKFCCVRWAPEDIPIAKRSQAGALQVGH